MIVSTGASRGRVWKLHTGPSSESPVERLTAVTDQ